VIFLLAYFYLIGSVAYASVEVSEAGMLRPTSNICLRALFWPVFWIPWILIVAFKEFNRRGGGSDG
jgi:hypothetical protein